MMLVAAAAMTFASCQKQEMNDSETFSTTLTLNAEVATKTYLEDNTILWGVGETVKLYLAASEGTPIFMNSTPNDAISGKKTASFEFALENIANGPYTIGGIYPASAVVKESNEKAVEYKVVLPAIQDAEPGKYDPSAFIMVLKPETMDQLPETHMASFRRAVALNKITLTGVTEAISSVTISVPNGKELHGRRYFDLTTGNSGDVYYGTDRNKITVNSEYTPTGETNSFDVWFTSWGVELTENEELTIQMTSATGIYTRTIAARAEGIKFLEGDLNTLTVNMASAQKETFENLSGEYLLVSSKNNVWSIMSQTVGGTSTKYINAIATSVNAETVSCEDFYNVSGVESYVWTVAQAEGGYTFATVEGQYLTYPGSGNASDLSETSTVLGLQVDNTNKAMITYTTRALKYYSTSPRFAFYESAQQDVYLIPWTEDLTKRIIVDNNAYDVNAVDTSIEFGYFVKNIAGNPTVSVKAGATMSGVSASVSADKVTVSFAANNDTIEKTAIIVLSYEGAEPVEVTIIQGAKVGGEVVLPASATLTFDAEKSNRISHSSSKQVWEQNSVKLINDKSSSTSAVPDAGGPAKFYKNSKITIEFGGAVIKKIDFVCNKTSYTDEVSDSMSTLGSVSISDKVVTVVLSTPSESVVATVSAAFWLDSITVYSN